MTTKSKDDILALDDLPTREVEVPEWDCTVTIRTMTGREREDFELAMFPQGVTTGKRPKLEGMKALLIQLTVLNGDGELMFAPADIPALERKSAAALNRIADAALRLNGLTKADAEELLGNSLTPQPAASGSG